MVKCPPLAIPLEHPFHSKFKFLAESLHAVGWANPFLPSYEPVSNEHPGLLAFFEESEIGGERRTLCKASFHSFLGGAGWLFSSQNR